MSVKPPKLPPIEQQSHNSYEVAKKDKTSTSYTLTGSNTKHLLPSQQSLQPNQDTKSGEIESWPAYASQSVSDTSLIGKSFHKDLTIVKKSIIPKPKFLVALETYVRKEIVELECSDGKPNELRLQAYREVFEYLIEDFKTYKPLLSQIKNEYEKMLSHYRQKIRELEPLKSMLITVSEQCDQKVMKIREEERLEILNLRRNKMELLRYIDSMREKEVSLQAQVAKLQEELSTEYRKYRNECDMRKLLISDMNDLRHQQEDLKRAAGQGTIDADDDPIRLKLSLKVAREDLSRQADELTRMQADYGDVVPRRNFEMLEAKFAELNEKYTTLTDDFQQLKDEHETILDVHKQVLDQRDQFYTEAETLRRSATPRPQWKKCGEIVPGGPEYWRDVSSGKSSEEILQVLIGEFKTGSQGPDLLDGKGTSEDIPKYLRFEGTVRNRKLSKAELSAVLKEIWVKKVTSDAEVGKRQKMTDFLFDFFMLKFNNLEEIVAEWGYSLHDALNNYKDEHYASMFLAILTEDGPEDLYYQEMEIMKKLMAEFDRVDVEKTGNLSIDQFMAALNVMFPLKQEPSTQALFDAAIQELELKVDENTLIDYKALFTEDEEGHTGSFLNALRLQDNEEKEAYVAEIGSHLEGNEKVSVADLKNELMMNDPKIDQEHMNNYLQIAFKCEAAELDAAEDTELSVILDRMRKGGIRRIDAL
uniref:translin-associated factor X-interacting protein 1 n=1 Tax=Ciona intestinalis TaxID=7719 RepID=UPI00089DC8DE|nr:translin-associated factor X-interacting protein 1 [Ciona intestinalis]|eukprot:XP_018668511.1 translin-associated factor X-interacting protein 1 [Ciona intestinalis]